MADNKPHSDKAKSAISELEDAVETLAGATASALGAAFGAPIAPMGVLAEEAMEQVAPQEKPEARPASCGIDDRKKL